MQDMLSWLQGSGLTGFYIVTFIIGAAHALEPGHGKTVVAAYLVGSKGKTYEAVLLGLIVTLTHTFSIIILAVLVKYAAMGYTKEELHAYLGFVAAILILGVGVWMMFIRWRAIHRLHHHNHGVHGQLHGHGHDHDHGHEHAHDDAHGHANEHAHGHAHSDDEGHHHGHEHYGHDEHGHDGHGHSHSHGIFSHSHYEPEPGEKLSFWRLFVMGISGGIVPCPAAFAVLLGAISTGEIAKGLSLVLVFSLGLAATLVAIGVGVVKTAGFAKRFMDTEKFAPYVAMGSAVLITFIGVVALLNSMKDMATV